MDQQLRDRPPYHAVTFLAEWAAEHWNQIDGLLLPSGQDPIDLPFRRILNFAYTLVTKDFDAEQRAHFDKLMEEPDVVAAEEAAAALTESDEMVRRTAGNLGFNVERAAAAAWEARQAGLAELERRRRAGEPLPTPPRDVSRVPPRPSPDQEAAAHAALIRDEEALVLDTSPSEWVAEGEAVAEREAGQ